MCKGNAEIACSRNDIATFKKKQQFKDKEKTCIAEGLFDIYTLSACS